MSEAMVQAGPTAPMWNPEPPIDLSADEVRQRALEMLETGGVVFLRDSGFELTAAEREMISDTRTMLAGLAEPEIQNGRPTIVYDPLRHRITRPKVRPPARERLEAMMDRYSHWARELVATLLPSYTPALALDRVTYRPHARSTAQGLHIDSSYGHPTQGRSMLRVFCNIDPSARPRVWQVGEPFEPFVRRFLPSVQRRRPSRAAALLGRLGLIGGAPTAYDQVVADVRGLAKRDETYQQTAPRRIVEFPAGSCWIAITDLVLHGALTGQHSLDQTFFLPAAGMSDPSRSSLRTLERLTGRRLT